MHLTRICIHEERLKEAASVLTQPSTLAGDMLGLRMRDPAQL